MKFSNYDNIFQKSSLMEKLDYSNVNDFTTIFLYLR